MAGLPYFGVKLASGHCPEGQALQALELRGAKNPTGVYNQSCLRSGLRPGLLGVLKFSLKKLLVSKQTKQNQPKVPQVPSIRGCEMHIS